MKLGLIGPLVVSLGLVGCSQSVSPTSPSVPSIGTENGPRLALLDSPVMKFAAGLIMPTVFRYIDTYPALQGAFVEIELKGVFDNGVNVTDKLVNLKIDWKDGTFSGGSMYPPAPYGLPSRWAQRHLYVGGGSPGFNIQIFGGLNGYGIDGKVITNQYTTDGESSGIAACPHCSLP